MFFIGPSEVFLLNFYSQYVLNLVLMMFEMGMFAENAIIMFKSIKFTIKVFIFKVFVLLYSYDLVQ